jgi:hypothetical protein
VDGGGHLRAQPRGRAAEGSRGLGRGDWTGHEDQKVAAVRSRLHVHDGKLEQDFLSRLAGEHQLERPPDLAGELDALSIVRRRPISRLVPGIDTVLGGGFGAEGYNRFSGRLLGFHANSLSRTPEARSSGDPAFRRRTQIGFALDTIVHIRHNPHQDLCVSLDRFSRIRKGESMKTTMCALCAVLAFATVAAADEVYIPDNQFAGSVNVIPFSGPWPGSSNPNGEWRYQWWIPAASMNGKAGLIKEIAVAPNYTGTLVATTCEYALGTNTLTTPSSTFDTNLPNPVVCYKAGAYTWKVTKGVWAPVGLQSGFVYDGTSNLVIQVRFKNSTIQGTTYIGCYYDGSKPNNSHRLYKYGPGAYTAATGSGLGGNPNGLRLRVTIDLITLTGSGTTNPGGTVILALSAPADAGLPYQVGTSLGTGPIPIGTRSLNLTADALLVASVGGFLPTVFANYSGVLDKAGAGKAQINIPSSTLLIGVRLHSAFVTLNASAPQGVQSISPTFSFAITK